MTGFDWSIGTMYDQDGEPVVCWFPDCEEMASGFEPEGWPVCGTHKTLFGRRSVGKKKKSALDDLPDGVIRKAERWVAFDPTDERTLEAIAERLRDRIEWELRSLMLDADEMDARIPSEGILAAALAEVFV